MQPHNCTAIEREEYNFNGYISSQRHKLIAEIQFCFIIIHRFTSDAHESQ
jgi:hypothetical protein